MANKGVSLAKTVSALKPGVHEKALKLAGGRYRALKPIDQLRCRAELHAIKNARRGLHEAVPSGNP